MLFKSLLGFSLILITGCSNTQCVDPNASLEKLSKEISATSQAADIYALNYKKEAVAYWTSVRPTDSVCGMSSFESIDFYCLHTAEHKSYFEKDLNELNSKLDLLLEKYDILVTTYPNCFDSAEVVDAKQRLNSSD